MKNKKKLSDHDKREDESQFKECKGVSQSCTYHVVFSLLKGRLGKVGSDFGSVTKTLWAVLCRSGMECDSDSVQSKWLKD